MENSLNSILMEKKIYSSFWGRLFYTGEQHSCVISILSSIEETFGIYLSEWMEYARKTNIAYDKYLYRLDSKAIFHPDARARRKTGCVQCGGCCWTWPCRVTDEEIEKISDYLGMSKIEFIEKHTVIIDNGRNLCRQEWKELANTVIYGERLYDINTPCEFFDDAAKKCGIHSVKPGEGIKYCCWEDVYENRRNEQSEK